MTPAAVCVLAVSMSMDAFAASIGRGAASGQPRFSEAVRTGMVFGIVEAITPLIGWAAGVAASGLVREFDHWVAYVLLGIVGGRMFSNACFRRAGEGPDPAASSFATLITTAIGTSLDAMVVGVSLAFLNVNIFVVAIAVGFVTFLFSTSGMMIGQFVGQKLGRIAEAIAGLALFGLGLHTLIEHLNG